MNEPKIDPHAPSVYLVQTMTPEEQTLAEQVDTHSGDSIPFWMLAKVAIRVHRLASWVQEMDGLFKKARRYLLAGVSAAAVNLSAIGIYILHSSEARGAATERAANQERSFLEYREATSKQLQELRLDIRELRAELRRLSGAGKPPTSDNVSPPDLIGALETTKGHLSCSIAPLNPGNTSL